MMTPEERENFEQKINVFPEELEEILVEAKELPVEKIERMLHIKSAVRNMINKF